MSNVYALNTEKDKIINWKDFISFKKYVGWDWMLGRTSKTPFVSQRRLVTRASTTLCLWSLEVCVTPYLGQILYLKVVHIKYQASRF